MKHNIRFKPSVMQRPGLVVVMTAVLIFGASTALYAATLESAKATTLAAPTAKPAKQCLMDLGVFQNQMQKDGYWRGVSGYGYGYPMYGYAYDAGMPSPAMTSAGASNVAEYWRARPGYEVRTLLAATQIMAQRGEQPSCEALLGETRKIYSHYAAVMRSGHVPRDVSGWHQAQLAAAQPVDGQNVSYRSDQLIGTEVLNPKGEELGSVDDLVLSPKTGKIAYLVIARGGLFGIDQKYVPVPWTHFKATSGAKMLVLDATKADMVAAPHVKENRFSAVSDFAKQSAQVDTYWSAHLPK